MTAFRAALFLLQDEVRPILKVEVVFTTTMPYMPSQHKNKFHCVGYSTLLNIILINHFDFY